MHNVTESLDNTNHMSIDGNRKLGSSNGHQQQTVDYSKKEIPKLNKLKKKRTEYRRTAFSKKWKILKSQAEILATQTGAEIKLQCIPTTKKISLRQI